MPPKGEEAPAGSAWSAQNETDAFKAFKAQMQPDGPPKPAAPTTARATPKQRGTLAINSHGTHGTRDRTNGRCSGVAQSRGVAVIALGADIDDLDGDLTERKIGVLG